MASAIGTLRKHQQLTPHAHRMRIGPSEPERVLWAAIRSSQLGTRFRRQVILLGYIGIFLVLLRASRIALGASSDLERDRRSASPSFVHSGLPWQIVI